MCKLTSQHHSAEHGVISVQRAAVPAVMSELVLALSDPLFGSLTNGLHQVWVPLAELPLLVHQARNVVTDHPCTQRSDVPAITDATNTVFIISQRGNSPTFYNKIHVKYVLLCGFVGALLLLFH